MIDPGLVGHVLYLYNINIMQVLFWAICLVTDQICGMRIWGRHNYRDLLVKFQCHINVEICAHPRSLKYLFKYCLEGHDRATVEIRGKKQRSNLDNELEQPEDEIQSFFDGRYICGCEAAYRIFDFCIHYRSLAVQRLSFHLEGDKSCTFRSNKPLQKVAAREKYWHTQLEAFFILNSDDPNSRQYLYDEIPQHYIWNDIDRIWTMRKRGKKLVDFLTHTIVLVNCGICVFFSQKFVVQQLSKLCGLLKGRNFRPFMKRARFMDYLMMTTNGIRCLKNVQL